MTRILLWSFVFFAAAFLLIAAGAFLNGSPLAGLFSSLALLLTFAGKEFTR